jgi:hypothetical protein
MSALLKELAVIALALLVTGGAVGALRDRAVLVPPPEMVVEEFVHQISLNRWAQARTHLTEELAHRLGPDSLRTYLARLEQRVGRIEDVRGRPFFATDVAAEATAEITRADGGHATLRLPLSREHGIWKIARLEGGD